MQRTSGKLAVRFALVAVLAIGLSSCNAGGGPGEPPLQVALFNFAPGFGGVALNAPLVLTFTTDIDERSVTADSIRIFTTTTTTQATTTAAENTGTASRRP